MTLRDYAAPLRSKPVGEVETADVLAVLEPIWQTKPETGSRLRGRIESVLERMKAGREHRVPLSSAALAVLQPLRELAQGELVFPGAKEGKPLSNMAMDKVLRLEQLDCTVHGFRSTFKDWATERTSFPGELSEVALAHVIKDKTEAAYRRGDMMERRRELMQAWAQFCAGVADSGERG